MSRKPGDPLVRPFRASAWGIVDANGDTVAKLYGPLEGRDALAQEFAAALEASSHMRTEAITREMICSSLYANLRIEPVPNRMYDWRIEAESIDDAADAIIAAMQAARPIASVQDDDAETEEALRLRVWNECKGRGMRDDDAYDRVNEALANRLGKLSLGDER